MLDDSKKGSYRFKVEPFCEDFKGFISWKNLGDILLRSAQFHADSHGFGFGVGSEERLSWVFSRLIIQMERRPRTHECFIVKTWPSAVLRQFTTRLYQIYDAEGKPVGHSYSVWALIDIDTRQPADLGNLPGGNFYDMLIPTPDFPISGPGRIRITTEENITEHIVNYSDLDVNGHLNSIRAIDLALDLMPAEFHRTHEASRIEMAYSKECVPGERLIIVHEFLSDGISNIEFRKEDGEVAVKSQILWTAE